MTLKSKSRTYNLFSTIMYLLKSLKIYIIIRLSYLPRTRQNGVLAYKKQLPQSTSGTLKLKLFLIGTF
jgi:hypothetical protein